MLYFLDPTENISGEMFSTLPDWARQIISRKWPFRFIDDATLVRCIESRIYFVRPSYQPSFNTISMYKGRKGVRLYLVLCKIKSYYFVKIGLTLKDNPLHRDSKVYKKVLFSKLISPENAELIETFLVWKCKEFYRQDPYDEKLMGSFAGRTESIFTIDEEIIPFFLRELDRIELGLATYEVQQIEFELWLVNAIVTACYLEEFLFSGHTCSYAFQDICHLFSNRSSVWQRLSPGDAIFAMRSLINKLAPVVDVFWNKCLARDPRQRYQLKKKKYDLWCRRKWPAEACDSTLHLDYSEWERLSKLGQPAPIRKAKFFYGQSNTLLSQMILDYKKNAGIEFSDSKTYLKFEEEWHNLAMKTSFHYNEGNNNKNKKMDIKVLLKKS